MTWPRMLWLMLASFASTYWRAYRWMGVLWLAVITFWWSVLVVAVSLAAGDP